MKTVVRNGRVACGRLFVGGTYILSAGEVNFFLNYNQAPAVREGWRVTSLFNSDLTEGMRPLVRQTVEYGFEIIGWVVLWHPIETLGFTPLTIRSRIAALRTLGAMDVVIRADQTGRLK